MDVKCENPAAAPQAQRRDDRAAGMVRRKARRIEMHVFREVRWHISDAEALQLARAMLDAIEAVDDAIAGTPAAPLKKFTAPPQSFLY